MYEITFTKQRTQVGMVTSDFIPRKGDCVFFLGESFAVKRVDLIYVEEKSEGKDHLRRAHVELGVDEEN